MSRLGSILFLFSSVFFAAAWPSIVACLVFGVGTALARNASGGVKNLDEDLYNRALAHAEMHEGLVERLRRGEVEALYEVAKSMNDSGDKISSVLIWHALADDGSQGEDYYAYDESEDYDYEGHVPSAEALGFSYYEVDKPRSLQYFLMATSKKGKPHQASMYNAGRLYLELEDPSSALAYIRACANLDRDHPTYARPQLSITCRKAYSTLSADLESHSDVGLEEAAECFLFADVNDFPLPNSKEFRAWDGAMKHLEKYAKLARDGLRDDGNSVQSIVGAMSGTSDSVRKRGGKHLAEAAEVLTHFKSSYGQVMSKLQGFLIGYMMDRILTMATNLESSGGEL